MKFLMCIESPERDAIFLLKVRTALAVRALFSSDKPLSRACTVLGQANGIENARELIDSSEKELMLGAAPPS